MHVYERLFGARYPLEWHMSELERIVMIAILEHLKPRVAIEVGCAQGGSLQVIAALAEKVYALDIDATVPHRLAQFPNVEFRIGPSHKTLPTILAELQQAQRPCSFILIDGDHRTEAVKRDIRALLSVPPLASTYVLFHDSFNPECREGLRTADWNSSPHVHSVELDFVPGCFHPPNSPLARQMWSGLAIALLSPERRIGPLRVNGNQELTFRQMYQLSAHWAGASSNLALQQAGPGDRL